MNAATENGEYPLGDFHVTLMGSTVPRENNSVALVLDRSGSMADPAGGTSTKSSLLKNAVSVFDSLMLPNDEIALVDQIQIEDLRPLRHRRGGAISVDLRVPVVLPRLRRDVAFLAPVPEAAVDEDRDAEPAERDVGDPAGLGQDGNMDAVANAACMQLTAQRRLGRFQFLGGKGLAHHQGLFGRPDTQVHHRPQTRQDQ
jgi:hypothetical protein